MQHTSSHDHVDHADARVKHVFSEELATIVALNSVTRAEKTHQRRVASYHTKVQTGSGSWMVPGMISPRTSQVKRCEALADLTNEVCALIDVPMDDNRKDDSQASTAELMTPESLLRNVGRSRLMQPPFGHECAKILQSTDKDWFDVIEEVNKTQPKRRSQQHSKYLATWYEARPNYPIAASSSPSTSPATKNRSSSIWGRFGLGSGNYSDAGIQTLAAEHLTGLMCTGLQDKRNVISTEYFIIDFGCPEKYYIQAKEMSGLSEQLYQMVIGDGVRFGVWLPHGGNFRELQVQSEDFLATIRIKASYAEAVLQRLTNMWDTQFLKCKQTLDALVYAAEAYDFFPEHHVDSSIIKQPLSDALWSSPHNMKDYPLGTAFACLAMFESGSLNINPIELNNVVAMASGNSLFMAEYVFNDPLESTGKCLVRRTIGSIGRPGTSFLVPVRILDSLEPADSNWRSVPYATFDGMHEDNFATTTLHLTFTGDEQPLNIGQTGFRDKSVFLIETVVRAYDRKRWVTDLDLSSPYSFNTYLSKQAPCDHTDSERQNFEDLLPITSIDSWDELIDLPPNLCIVRAKENWLARQAISAFAIQRKKQTVLSTGNLCWKCISESKYPSSQLLVIS